MHELMELRRSESLGKTGSQSLGNGPGLSHSGEEARFVNVSRMDDACKP